VLSVARLEFQNGDTSFRSDCSCSEPLTIEMTTRSSPPPIAVRARWVVPVDRPPIDGGIITIADGQIMAVGENGSGQPPHDLGDVALLPGLVNAHTHLEFSLLERPLGRPGMRFTEWIGQVVAWRRESGIRSQGSGVGGQQSAILSGLDQTRAAGVAAVGEIATANCEPIAHMDRIEMVAFRELLGLGQEQVEPLLLTARHHIDLAEASGRRSRVHAGLSPHAPYTVHPDLLHGACALSAQHSVPLAMHLAESREELALLRSHTGELVELLRSLKAWHPEALPRGLTPLHYLQTLAGAHRALVVHGNYLDHEEIEFIGERRERMSLVFCPRTHAYFRHDPYPLIEMLSAGARVAVGTDSRASNPDLRLWEELRHIARQFPSISPLEILRMGTLSGSEALGIEDSCGSIAPGKSAALAVVPVSAGAAPLETLLERDVQAMALWDFLSNALGTVY
jgi:cytosine/adenosine deaminase-related metal-dependent hydrolase